MLDQLLEQLFADGWIQFTKADAGMMVGIAILSAILHRAAHVPNRYALLVPTTLGGIWGFFGGIEAGFGLGTHLMSGVVINGVLAAIAGRYFNEKWGDKLLGPITDTVIEPAPATGVKPADQQDYKP